MKAIKTIPMLLFADALLLSPEFHAYAAGKECRENDAEFGCHRAEAITARQSAINVFLELIYRKIPFSPIAFVTY